MNIDFEEIFKKLEEKARSISLDGDSLKELLNKAKVKIEDNQELMEVIEELKLFIELIGDYLSGRYRQLSMSAIITMVVALIYLISPIDLIPDFLIGGLLDDIAVILYAAKKVGKELEAYKKWKKEEDNIIDEDDFNKEFVEETDQFKEEDLDEDIFVKDDNIFTSR